LSIWVKSEVGETVEDLVLRAQQGDKEAFAQLVQEERSLVLRLAAGYLGWRDAEDAAQIIWTAVWRKIWQVEDPKSFGAWLRTLVLHQCLNLRKARARRRDREVQLSREAWQSLAECVGSGASALDELLENGEVRHLIARELELLPGEYGLLLELYYLKDLSYREISALTGLKAGALKWRLHQGRKLLKAKLTPHLVLQTKGGGFSGKPGGWQDVQYPQGSQASGRQRIPDRGPGKGNPDLGCRL